MDIRAAIRQAAIEEGIPPEYALAVASRESGFRPTARASRTISGLFQFTGKNRAALGLPDNATPEEQTRALARFSRGIRDQMGTALGRDPTDAETYYGHHFGAGRAAKMIQADPNTPVEQWFSPEEMAANPHFKRAGTAGKLMESIARDIDAREARYSDDAPADGFMDRAMPSKPKGTPMFAGGGLPAPKFAGGTLADPPAPTLQDFERAAEATPAPPPELQTAAAPPEAPVNPLL